MRELKRDVLKISIGLMAGAIAAGLMLGTADIAQAKKKVTINKKKATLKVGQKVKLKLKGLKAKEAKSVKWSSKNKSVAAVDKKGVVKAKKQGAARIVAKLGKKKYTCRIIVKKSSSSSESKSVDWTKVAEKFEILAEYISANGTETDDKLSIQSSEEEGDEKVSTKISYDSSSDVIIFEKKSVTSDGEGLTSVLTISKEEPKIASIESQVVQDGVTYIGSSEIEVAEYIEEDEALGFDFGDSVSDEDTSEDENSSDDSEDSESSSQSDVLDTLSTDFFNASLTDWNDYLTDAGTGVTLSDLGFLSYEF